MNYIISKGGTIARYTKGSMASPLILRTPISITLNPDKRAVYQVAGTYDKYGNPTGGFIEQNTYSNVQAMGWELWQRINSPISNQHWRSVTNSHDPEFCWYQGAFATAAPSIAQTLTSCEAYFQMGAYHFNLPALPSGIDMTIQISYTTGGACQAYQSAGTRSAQNKPLKGFSKWGNSWILPCAVYDGDLEANYNRIHISQIKGYNYVNLGNMLADGSTGNFRGLRDLWGFTGTNKDGAIPTLTTTLTKTINVSASQTQYFTGKTNGVWLIPYLVPTGSNIGNYTPSYYTSDAFWWACMSAWGLKMKITIGE